MGTFVVPVHGAKIRSSKREVKPTVLVVSAEIINIFHNFISLILLHRMFTLVSFQTFLTSLTTTKLV